MNFLAFLYTPKVARDVGSGPNQGILAAIAADGVVLKHWLPVDVFRLMTRSTLPALLAPGFVNRKPGNFPSTIFPLLLKGKKWVSHSLSDLLYLCIVMLDGRIAVQLSAVLVA